MNRRQAKKAFKRKYGINPNKEVNIPSNFDISKFMEKMAEAATRAFEIMQQWAKEVNERIVEIGIEATTEELQKKMEELGKGPANDNTKGI